MKITHYTEIPATQFSGEAIKNTEGRVVIGKEDGAENFCMRVFTVQPGGFSPRHSHQWEHEVFIHTGTAKIFRSGEWQEVGSGTAIFIPGGEEHQFINEGDKELVFVCLIPKGIAEL